MGDEPVRKWTVDIDGKPRRIRVFYEPNLGRLYLWIDGRQVLRAIRLLDMSVYNTAKVDYDLDGHLLEIRSTFAGRYRRFIGLNIHPLYEYALTVDGVVQPGSYSGPFPVAPDPGYR